MMDLTLCPNNLGRPSALPVMSNARYYYDLEAHWVGGAGTRSRDRSTDINVGSLQSSVDSMEVNSLQ